jgi:PBSX family phage terminase large subunit
VSERATLNPALRSFWATPARNRVLYGGRASSKSWDAAGFVIYLANRYKLRVCCARQFQARITDSVYTLLKTQIERFNLSHRFDVQRDKIYNTATGSEFLFYGLWRSIDEVKSLEGIDILWLEEAHNITEEQWEILNPTIRKENSQIWIIFNPRFASDFVYKRFVRNPRQTRSSASSITPRINSYQKRCSISSMRPKKRISRITSTSILACRARMTMTRLSSALGSWPPSTRIRRLASSQ